MKEVQGGDWLDDIVGLFKPLEPIVKPIIGG